MDRLPHVLEAQQFDIDLMDAIFSTAREMEQVVQHYGSNILSRRVMATLFYEPSTRTRLSFESAMTRLMSMFNCGKWPAKPVAIWIKASAPSADCGSC